MKIITKDQNGNVRVVTRNEKPSMTQQQFKEQVNVNKIIAKYRRTGMLEHVRKNSGAYLDITDIGDYQESLQKVIDANNIFSSLPSEIRTRFANDPQQLINFLADEKNIDEAIRLGLMYKKEAKAPEEMPPQKESEPE